MSEKSPQETIDPPGARKLSAAIQLARPRVGVPTRLAYGVGSVAFGVKDNGFTFFLLLFYNQVLGLPAGWVGAALMVALVVDGFVDPAIGQISDHWRSRLGRRHPFMYAAALPAAIGYALLWNPPAGLTPIGLFSWLIVLSVLVRMAIATYEVPSAALLPELSESYDQRTVLLSYRTFLAWCGGLFTTIIAYTVFLIPTPEQPLGQLNAHGYSQMGWFSGGVIFLVILVSTLGTHRFIPFLNKPTASAPGSARANMRQMLRALSNRSLLMLLAANLVSMMAIGVGSALNIYMATYFWELSTTKIAVLSLGLFAGAVIAFIFTPLLGRHFEKRTCALAVGVSHATASILPIVLRLLGVFPENEDNAILPVLIGFYVVSTASMVAWMILTTSMLADIVEDNEVRMGQRSEGVIFSVNLFIQKCVSGVGVFGAGLLLTLISFPEQATAGTVDATVVRTLGAAFAATQLLCYAPSVVFLIGYKITRHGHAQNLQTLRERNVQGRP